jgi:DNA-binding NtrC family response regulator
VVDDDVAVGKVLAALLTQEGHRVTRVVSAEDALSALEHAVFDVVLSDVRMPGIDGLELLQRLKESVPELPVVLISAEGTVPMAVEAMKAGAAEFMMKPFGREEIAFVIAKAIQKTAHAQAAPPARPAAGRATGTDLRTASGMGDLIGASPIMEQVYKTVQKVASSGVNVLILGETGTGKELVARALHDASPRKGKPFVAVNCGALGICSRANCSGMRRAHSPARFRASRVASNLPIKAHCSSTRSARYRSMFK